MSNRQVVKGSFKPVLAIMLQVTRLRQAQPDIIHLESN